MTKNIIIIILLIIILVLIYNSKVKNIELFYNEFNNNYLIVINGQVYKVNNEIIINEFEDIEQYNLQKFIDIK